MQRPLNCRRSATAWPRQRHAQAPRKADRMVLLLAACVSVFTTLGIVYILV
jgi:hypothetical protein